MTGPDQAERVHTREVRSCCWTVDWDGPLIETSCGDTVYVDDLVALEQSWKIRWNFCPFCGGELVGE